MRQEGGAKKIRVSLNKNKKRQNLTRKQKALKTIGFQRFTILISDHDRDTNKTLPDLHTCKTIKL